MGRGRVEVYGTWEGCLPTQRLSPHQSFHHGDFRTWNQDLSSPIRAASQRPWLSAITQAEAGDEEFPEHLGQEINHNRNSHAQTRKSPQSKRSGSNCYMAVSFLHFMVLLGLGLGGWGQDAKSYPLWSAIYTQWVTGLWRGHFGGFITTYPGEGQLEGFIKSEELKAVPWRCAGQKPADDYYRRNHGVLGSPSESTQHWGEARY